MQHLENVSFTRDFTSRYMKPMHLTFQKDGVNRQFDMVAKHGSVATLLYHKEFNKFLVVRQFRPAVFVGRITKLAENSGKEIEEIDWSKYDAEVGYTIELCAGLLDKDLPPKEIAREEIEEECGYFLPSENIHFLATYTVDAEESDSQQFLFYAELEEKYKKTEGGGNISEGEQITKVFLEIEEARRYMEGEESRGPPGACFAFQWWFHTKPENRFRPLADPVFNWTPTIDSLMQHFHIAYNMKSTRLHPIRMFYTLASITRSWDLSPSDDTIIVFVYKKDSKEILLTQRFRPAKFVLNTIRLNKGEGTINWDQIEQTRAYTLEMCSTHCNSLTETEDKVRECLRIKLGYEACSVKYITSFITGISMSGDRQRVYYAEVDDSTKVANFSQINEIIQVTIPVEKLPCLLRQSRPFCPPAVLYMIYRFLYHTM